MDKPHLRKVKFYNGLNEENGYFHQWITEKTEVKDSHCSETNYAIIEKIDGVVLKVPLAKTQGAPLASNIRFVEEF